MPKKKRLATGRLYQTTPLPANTAQLFDNYRPGLPEGNYRIQVVPSLSPMPDSTFQTSDLPSLTQNFVVQGPRFTALPPDALHAFYPSPNSTGAFANDLPHVLFSKLTLPWERQLSGLPATTPWLALLVFKPTELQTPSFNPVMDQLTYTYTDTVANLLKADPYVFKPKLALSDDEQALSAQAIQIGTTTFSGIMPNQWELPYLTHCRQVNSDNTAVFSTADTGFFSLAMTNRFPNALNDTTAQPYVAHLVSLEGFEAYLAVPMPAFTKPSVQLFTLASWTFNCSPQPQEDFATLMSALQQEQALSSGQGLLRLPPLCIEDQVFQTQLIKGYVPLNYHAQQAQDGYAWYRGPLTPLPVTSLPLNTWTGITNNQALEPSPVCEMDNLAYASAWQLGRSLAIADAGFMQSLQALRQQENEVAHAQAARAVSLWQVLQTVDAASQTSLPLAPPVPTNIVPNMIATLSDCLVGPMTTLLHSGTGTKQPSLSAPYSDQGSSTGNDHWPAQHGHPAFFKPSAAQRRPSLMGLYQQQRAALKHQQRQRLAAWQDTALALPAGIKVKDWLTDLYLLTKVPFSCLVADEGLLPVETVRFFYVDANWLNALVAGALSVGIHTTADQTLNGSILQALIAALAANDTQSSQVPVCGFLVRSQAIAAWPNLTVQVQGTNDLSVQVIAQSRLAPTVLFCLLNGIAQGIQLCEPHEQLRLGVEPSSDSADRRLTLRQLASNAIGRPLDPPVSIAPLSQFFRVKTPVDSVLNITLNQPTLTPASPPPDLINRIEQELTTSSPQPLTSALTPAQWALTLLASPLQAEFGTPPPTSPTYSTALRY